MTYKLYRIEDDASIPEVSQHGDIVAGIAAGKQIVEQDDFDFAYSLHSNGTRLATFAEGRIGYREWAIRTGRLEYINSQDDKYDKEIEEILS